VIIVTSVINKGYRLELQIQGLGWTVKMYMRKSRNRVQNPEELHALQYPSLVMNNLITQRTEELYFETWSYCGSEREDCGHLSFDIVYYLFMVCTVTLLVSHTILHQ